jgi:hypothetical protein
MALVCEQLLVENGCSYSMARRMEVVCEQVAVAAGYAKLALNA